MDIDYSVIIRTTGKAKERYASLLRSIAALIPQPKEVIVVLPDGYEKPNEQLGWETFHFCPKGMVSQRIKGIQCCRTRYALVCDDDIRFDSDFVQKLHKPIAQGIGSLSAAPLYSFFPQGKLKAIVKALIGDSVPTLFHRERYVSVLRTTGFSYNKHLRADQEFYETCSAAGCCFYADIEALRSIDYETEQVWLDSHGYAALDDQVMFYKAWLRGLKTIIVTAAAYDHLNARTSTASNLESIYFSRAFNRVVFWHRFILSQEQNSLCRLWARICLEYYWITNCPLNYLLPLSRSERQAFLRGRKEAKHYLVSEEYTSLASVK